MRERHFARLDQREIEDLVDQFQQIPASLQNLVKAALLGLVAAGNISGQVNLGQSLAITVIVADTIVAVIGIALGVQIRRRMGTLDVRDMSSLRG